MIRIIIACALVSLAAAAVIPDDAQAQIISYHNENDGSGNYDFSFETSNGLRRKEVGRVINPGAENQYTDVEGSFSYTDADGKLVEVFYSADENGYHVKEKPRKKITDRNFSPSVVASLLGK
ncbi:hypothetical protein PYW07_015309 [Mythimna separata]|uniref:Uncharacterized protein n=1 Tax=Mythimna separata TaxID=271217 RepID=A0AAD7Z003_MYTSE|nr:hypothetical protein PYW07_015309 [Mythimna separata]